MKLREIVIFACALVLLSTTAEARPRKPVASPCVTYDDRYPCSNLTTSPSFQVEQSAPTVGGGCGPRPGRWCGWWVHMQKGCAYGRNGPNLARWWRTWGRPSGPQVGAVAVVRGGGHVGVVSSVEGSTFTLHSGNTGRRGARGVGYSTHSVSGTVFRI